MKRIIFLLLLSSVFVSTTSAAGPRALFQNRKDGYPVFRIPSVIATGGGKLLAFCEGRKSIMDHGDIDLVMKSSTDGGKTWSGLQVIWDDGKHTCGNPTPVFDRVTGDVLVVATLDNDKVFVLRSRDEGSSWGAPLDITSAVKLPNWNWVATGPVHAIQLTHAPSENRLVVPCNHTVAGMDSHISHTIYSDDHGQTWRLGGVVPEDKTDECSVVELADGNLLLNMRNNDRAMPNRKISLSHDGGLTWSAPQFDAALIEPICQGALLHYSTAPDILLFSNPQHPKKRKNLTLSISKDDGKTWAKRVTICAKKSAYSDMVVLSNGDVLCLFETGKILPYGGIWTATIPSSAIVE